jgi:protein-disulfide isomerase
MAARFRAIASDFGFYELMAPRGFSRAAVDRCLADKDMAQRIAAQSAQARELDVPGTPSFAIGGALLDSVHDWPTLETALKAQF